MKRIENEQKGLFTLCLDDLTLNFGRMKYDGKEEHYKSDCVLSLKDFVTYPTKKEAIAAAKKLSWGAKHVQRIGSRFWSCWGLRYDFRDCYFLLRQD